MASIVPPFTLETATKKTKAAQDLWNTRDAEKVAGAYTVCVLNHFLWRWLRDFAA